MRKLAIIPLTLAMVWMPHCGGGSSTTPAPTILGPAPGTIQPLQKVYTEHLGQLIGTALNPTEPYGFTGADLGITFEQDGRLIFLFGDVRAIEPSEINDDAMAWVDLGSSPAETRTLPQLNWFERLGGLFMPMLFPGVNMKTFHVPVEGFALGSTSYVFAASGYDAGRNLHTISALAHTQGLAFESLTVDHQVTDGVPAAAFLTDVIHGLEDPAALAPPAPSA